MLLALCLTIALSASVFGADTVRQTSIYSDKIAISFDPAYVSSYYEVAGYSVYLRTDYESEVLVKTLDKSATGCELTGLSPSHSYDVIVKYKERNKNSGAVSDWHYHGTIYDAKMAPAKVSGAKQDVWYHYIKKISVIWNKQRSITGYECQLLSSSGKVLKKAKLTSPTSSYYTFENISNSKTYKLRVRGYTEFNGSTKYGPWSNTAYLIGQTPNVKVSFSGKKMKVKWGKVTGATSYTIMVSTRSDKGFKAVKTISAKKSRKATIKKFKGKKFKKGKTYYVYVRTNKKAGGKTYKSNSKDGLLYVSSAYCR